MLKIVVKRIKIIDTFRLEPLRVVLSVLGSVDPVDPADDVDPVDPPAAVVVDPS